VNPRSHRLFFRLALLAALLLATVPTLGRLLGPAAAVPAPVHAMAMSMAMHHGTAHAMETMAHGAPHGHAPAGAPHSGHGHEHDGDCAYCPLLGSVLAAQTLALDVPPPVIPRHAVRTEAAAPRIARLRGNLGSRGPPHRA
jgi:hypothetical protein